MRPASHAGSCFPGNVEVLRQQLQTMFQATKPSTKEFPDNNTQLRALVSPHAGMPYSGPVASKGYAALSQMLQRERNLKNRTLRFFIFGPSHCAYIGNSCQVSAFESYNTPYGAFSVDADVSREIMTASEIPIRLMNPKAEIAEHSIEMQLPFLAHALEQAGVSQRRVRIIPILVGNLSKSAEKHMASVFQQYWDDSSNYFLFSGDFCHWGERFNYRYHYEKERLPVIDDAIDAMDKEGIACLINRKAAEWYDYFHRTENTICGRHPFGVLLHMMNRLETAGRTSQMRLFGYSKSNACQDDNDSRVSYASLGVWL